MCLSRLANTLWFLGHADDARAACHQALGQATQANHPFSANVVNIFAAMLAVDLAEHDAVAGYAAALWRDRDRSRVFEINAEAMTGYADVVAGQAGGRRNGSIVRSTRWALRTRCRPRVRSSRACSSARTPSPAGPSAALEAVRRRPEHRGYAAVGTRDPPAQSRVPGPVGR